jgi:hypothetical protein
MTGFSPETIEAIGGYVYALVDPRKPKTDPRRIFYVGKGIGQRCFAHAAAEVKWNRSEEPNPKIKLIREIRQAIGAPPLIQLISHRLTDEESHRLEAALISVLQTEGNLASGKYAAEYGLPVSEIEGLYSHPLKELELRHRVLLVSLNGGRELPPFTDIQESEMPRRVLQSWPLSEHNANQVEYIVGVYRQLTRRVFKVQQTASGLAVHDRINTGEKKNGYPNWKRAFYGERCSEMELLWVNRRIVDTSGEVLTKFPRQVGCRLIGTHSKD